MAVSNEFNSDWRGRHAIAAVLAEALLESSQLSTLESGLADQGLYLNLPSKPTLSETEAALEALLDRNPELVPVKEFWSKPAEDRIEWATDRLTDATVGGGDF
jgi:hypothetical protein